MFTAASTLIWGAPRTAIDGHDVYQYGTPHRLGIAADTVSATALAAGGFASKSTAMALIGGVQFAPLVGVVLITLLACRSGRGKQPISVNYRPCCGRG